MVSYCQTDPAIGTGIGSWCSTTGAGGVNLNNFLCHEGKITLISHKNHLPSHESRLLWTFLMINYFVMSYITSSNLISRLFFFFTLSSPNPHHHHHHPGAVKPQKQFSEHGTLDGSQRSWERQKHHLQRPKVSPKVTNNYRHGESFYGRFQVSSIRAVLTQSIVTSKDKRN